MIRVATFFTVPARAAIAVASTPVTPAATTVAITARTAVAPVTAIATRFAWFARRAGVFELGTGFLVNDAHR